MFPHALKGNWWLVVVMGIVGGLGMFLFGMELGAGGLQKVAGNKMRILAKLTTNRVMAVCHAIITAVVRAAPLPPSWWSDLSTWR